MKVVNPIEQKGRCVPSHLQDRVEKKVSKLIDPKHIKKHDKCSDKHFIGRIVN